MVRLRTVCLAAVALTAVGFFVGRMLVAQDRSEPARHRGFGGGGQYGLGKLNLLQSKDVQKELALTDAEKTTLEKFSEEMHSQMRTQFEGLRGLSQEDRDAKIAELRPKLEQREKEVQAKLDEVLNSQQKDRLGQIELQARHIDAFAQKDVVDALQLTDDQKKKISDLRDKLNSDRRDLFGGGGGPRGPGGPGAGGPGAGGPGAGGPSTEMRQKFKKLNEDSMAKAKEILTSDQRDKFDAMLGKTFEGDLGQFGGTGGRGGRGGRRNRGGANPSSDNAPPKSADKPATNPATNPTDKPDAAAAKQAAAK